MLRLHLCIIYFQVPPVPSNLSRLISFCRYLMYVGGATYAFFYLYKVIIYFVIFFQLSIQDLRVSFVLLLNILRPPEKSF